MRSITSIIVVFFLAFLLVSTFVADRFAARHYQLEAAPPSAFEMALQSRTTAPAESGGRGSTLLFGAGIFALVVVVIGGAVVAMNSGGEFKRQMRLSNRRQRPRPSLTISGPQSPLADMPQLPVAPQMRRIQPVEEAYYQE
jgi:hypothetical protein